MPADELLALRPIELTLSLEQLLSKPGCKATVTYVAKRSSTSVKSVKRVAHCAARVRGMVTGG